MLIGYFALRLVYINFRKENIFFHCYFILFFVGFCCLFSFFSAWFSSLAVFFLLLLLPFCALNGEKIVLHLNVSFKLDYTRVCVYVFSVCNLLRLNAPLLRYSLILIHQFGAMQWMCVCGFLWPRNEIETKATNGREKKAFQTHIFTLIELISYFG